LTLIILQFLIKLILMFLIHWGYSLLCLLACVGIWAYIGQAPASASSQPAQGAAGPVGYNPGVASEFSMIDFVKTAIAKWTG